MKNRIWRFITDPYYPDEEGRRRLRRALLSAAATIVVVAVIAFYTIGPLLVLVGGAVAQRDITAHVPIDAKTVQEAEQLIAFHALLVSWRWVFIVLCLPLLWEAARGRFLWLRFVMASFVTFVIALLYFEALKSHQRLEGIDRLWSAKLPPRAANQLAGLLFWFDAWQIGFGIIGLGSLASLVAALMAERK